MTNTPKTPGSVGQKPSPRCAASFPPTPAGGITPSGDASGSGDVASAIQAPKKGKKKKNRSKSNKKTIGKTVGHFKCTSDTCGKTWTSVHAWTSSRFKCEFCQGWAKVIKAEEGECELDNYCCKSCDNYWQSIHSEDDGSQQQCNLCDDVIVKEPDSMQRRFGTHYWYQCKNKECSTEWEDFWCGKKYGQRCTKCGSAGEMFATSTQTNLERQRSSRSLLDLGGSGSSHNIEGCDMCQALVSQGIARTCMRKKLVVIKVDEDEQGNSYEEIVAAR